MISKVFGGVGGVGGVGGLWHDNHTTSWPILQAKDLQEFSWAEFQDGPSVAIRPLAYIV